MLVRQGRVLLVRRADGVPRAGYWSPPTGRIEPGESAAQAVTREAREELGLEVRPLAEVWRCATDDGRYRLLWWLAESDASDPVANGDEVAEWRWIEGAQFAEITPAFDAHRHFFAEILPNL